MIKDKLKQNKFIYQTVRKIKYYLSYLKNVYCECILFYAKYFLRRIHVLKSDEYVKSLKDKYKEEKLFIIATGPSLSIETLERLKAENAITIAVNGIFKIFDKTSWRPDYYVIDDYWLIKKYVRDFPNMRLDNIGKKGTIFAEKCKKMIPYARNMKNTGFIPVCYFDHWQTHYSRHFRYNREVACGGFDFYTVTNFGINLADYMGAKEVFLIGVDCDYTSPVQHVGEEVVKLTESEIKSNLEMEYGMLNGYYMLSKLIGENLKIYNINQGGKVDMFPRITLEEALHM